MASIASILVDGQDPSMPALRAWLANLSGSVTAAAGGFRTFANEAALDAYTPAVGEPTYAFVTDPEFTAYKFTGALPWVEDSSYFEGVAAVVQPLLDGATRDVSAVVKAIALLGAPTGVVGRPSTPLATGETSGGASSQLWADPVPEGASSLAWLELAVQVSQPITIGRYTKSGSTATRVALYTFTPTVTTPGVRRFTSADFGNIPLAPGELLYLSAPGNFKYVENTADGAGWYDIAGVGGPATAALGAPITNLRLEVQFGINVQSVTAEAFADLVNGQGGDQFAHVANLLAAPTGIIGRATMPSAAGSVSLPGHSQMWANPVPADAVSLDSVTFAVQAAQPVTIACYTKSGSTATKVRSYTFTPSTTGVRTFTSADFGIIPLIAGEYLYLSAPGNFTYQENIADGAGWYDITGTGAPDSITLGAPITNLRLEVQFGINVQVVTAAAFAELGAELGRSWDSRDQVVACTASVSGSVLTLSDTALLRAGVSVPFNGAVTHSMPASGKQRLDFVTLDPETMALGITAGTARDLDAAEVPPSLASGLIKLFAVLVTTSGLSIAPTWMLEDGTIRTLASGRRADIERGRRSIAATLAAATRGQPITHICETDSIGAWSNATANSSFVPSNTAPNGARRDLKDYLSNTGGPQRIANDVINALPTYDDGDGAGQVHVRASKYRQLSAALGRWGSNVQHLNFGLAGTDSGTGKSGMIGTSSNGRDSDLLNAVLAAVAAAVTAGRVPVVSLGYGMNELGSGGTEPNIVAIATAVYVAGGDVIVWGCPRPNPTSGLTLANWRITCRALRRAAEYVHPATGKSAAYIDTVRISDDPAIGALGIPAATLCVANGINHPGLFEHRREAREAIDLVGYA